MRTKKIKIERKKFNPMVIIRYPIGMTKWQIKQRNKEMQEAFKNQSPTIMLMLPPQHSKSIFEFKRFSQSPFKFCR